MTLQDILPARFLSNYKERSLYRLLGIICFFWLMNSFLAWIYLCKIEYNCYPTHLFINYFAGIFFWFLAVPFIVKETDWLRESPMPAFRKGMIHFALCALIIITNQFFVLKAIQLSYVMMWDFTQPEASLVNTLMTNNILVNIIFYCLIIRTALQRQSFSHSFSADPSEDALQSEKPEQIPFEESNGKFYGKELAIKDGSTIYNVSSSAIRFVRADQNCVHIYTDSRKYVIYSSLVRFSGQLPPHEFIRIHRSTIVNKRNIQQIRNLTSGDAEVVLHDGTSLKCSRNYKKSLPGYCV